MVFAFFLASVGQSIHYGKTELSQKQEKTRGKGTIPDLTFVASLSHGIKLDWKTEINRLLRLK